MVRGRNGMDTTDGSPEVHQKEITLGSLTVNRLSHHRDDGPDDGDDARPPFTFVFNDAEGIRRTILDPSGDLQRMLDAALQGHTASTTQSGNAKKDFLTS